MTQVIEMAIPTGQVGGMIDTLLSMLEGTAEALGRAATAYLEGELTLEELEERRRRLADVEGALDDLGWRLPPRRGPAELAGPPLFVHEVIYGALMDAAQAVAETCRAYETGRAELSALRRSVEDVRSRFALFAELEDREAI